MRKWSKQGDTRQQEEKIERRKVYRRPERKERYRTTCWQKPIERNRSKEGRERNTRRVEETKKKKKKKRTEWRERNTRLRVGRKTRMLKYRQKGEKYGGTEINKKIQNHALKKERKETEE